MVTNPRLASRILRLVLEIARDPRGGIGKPERLKHAAASYSRRIDGEHRLIYRFDEAFIEFLSARHPYE